MAIKKHFISPGTLLISVFIIYTLIPLGSITFARESNNREGTAAIEVTTHIDKNEVTIGDKITLNIRVKHKDGITIEFPEPNQKFGIFTIKGTGIVGVSKSENDGYSTTERNYVLNSYEIGHQIIPPLKIKYRDNQTQGEVATGEIAIDIKGILKEGETATDIKDISPPVDIPTNFRRLILWICVGLAALLLSCAIYWFIAKRKKIQKRQEQVIIKRAPYEVAYELLEKLAKEDLIARGFVKEYYYRITDIIRHYIEDQFGLSAPERTTEEFLIEMAHTSTLNNNHKLLIREFLEYCDMVKYAKYGPSHIEVKETSDIARRFVDETKRHSEEKEVIAGKNNGLP
jgi:hypothetical protein